MKNCHVVLLRGINVGGHNKLRMAEFAALLEELGFTGVRTYIQSGNVVLGAGAKQARNLSSTISAALDERFDLQIPIVTRKASAFRAVLKGNPFLAEGADVGSLHASFLASKPKAAAIAELDPNLSPGDEYRIVGDTIYIHCPNGLARTKLTNVYFDRKLKTVSTYRNWKTVMKIDAMIEEFAG